MAEQVISTALPVETPEGITFNYEPAPLTRRMMAYLLDTLIRAGVMVVVGTVVGIVSAVSKSKGFGIGLYLLLLFLLEWGYFVLFDALLSGQSPGKRALGLRVVRITGHPIGFYDSMLRNILRAADLLPFTYTVGVIAFFCTERFQRLGDLVAGTVVIQEKRAWFSGRAPVVDARLAAGEHRGVVLSNRERRLLEEFFARKDRLHPDRAEQIAETLATPYRRRFALPERERPSELLLKLLAANSEPGVRL